MIPRTCIWDRSPSSNYEPTPQSQERAAHDSYVLCNDIRYIRSRYAPLPMLLHSRSHNLMHLPIRWYRSFKSRGVVKPFEPFVTDELTVCNQTFDAVTSEQSDEPRHDVDSLLEVGVRAFLQESEQDGERHMIIRYAQY